MLSEHGLSGCRPAKRWSSGSGLPQGGSAGLSAAAHGGGGDGVRGGWMGVGRCAEQANYRDRRRGARPETCEQSIAKLRELVAAEVLCGAFCWRGGLHDV